MKIILTESQLVRLIENPDDGRILSCKTKYNISEFNKAKQWWYERLSSPITIEKIAYNNNRGSFNKMTEDQRNKALSVASDSAKKAIQMLKSVKVEWISQNNDERFKNRKLHALAFYESPDNTVYLDCDRYPENQLPPQSLFVHELQHSINRFLGETEDAITTLYGNKRVKVPSTWKERKMETAKFKNLPKLPPLSDGYSDEFLRKIFKDYIKKNNLNGDDGYWCSPDELQSRVQEVRVLLGLKPNEHITMQLLSNNKIARDRMTENILCWVSRTDNVTFEEFLRNINQLAKNNNKNSNANGWLQTNTFV